jgi:hypothetical protein
MTSDMIKDYRKCHMCQGRKKYSPLGHIERTCAVCDGVGYHGDKVKNETMVLSSAVPKVIMTDVESNDSVRAKLVAQAERKAEIKSTQSSRMKAYHEARRLAKRHAESGQ